MAGPRAGHFRSPHREMYVVLVLARRVAVPLRVRLPATTGQPDAPEPDHIEDAQLVRVVDEVVGQPVAVVLAGARRDPAEAALVGREVARPALRMLAAVLVA